MTGMLWLGFVCILLPLLSAKPHSYLSHALLIDQMAKAENLGLENRQTTYCDTNALGHLGPVQIADFDGNVE